MNKNKSIILSLELHLFFSRIMKEHALFLEAGFTPVNSGLAREADNFKETFENILFRTVKLSDGIISKDALASGEIVTDFTLRSEKNTEKLSGIDINTEITKLEMCLQSYHNDCIYPDDRVVCYVEELNREALALLDTFIDFKETVLRDALSCRIFTFNYPLLIEHILREAKLYRTQLSALQSGCDFDECIRETELFWDRIMMEHALFIRGLLDPTEKELIKQADNFADEYEKLLKEAKHANDRTIECVTEKTLRETKKIREFKQAGTIGLNDCTIKSIIIPLLADHVLREANHFIRILKKFD